MQTVAHFLHNENKMSDFLNCPFLSFFLSVLFLSPSLSLRCKSLLRSCWFFRDSAFFWNAFVLKKKKQESLFSCVDYYYYYFNFFFRLESCFFVRRQKPGGDKAKDVTCDTRFVRASGEGGAARFEDAWDTGLLSAVSDEALKRLFLSGTRPKEKN